MKKLVYILNQFAVKLNSKHKNKLQNFKKDLEDEQYNFSCRV